MAAEQAQAAAGAAAATEEASFLEQILDHTRAPDPQSRERNKDYITQFLRNAVKPGQVVSRDVETTIKTWIAEIDRKLSGQLNEVMHAPEFQKLEGTWRGLHYLVHQSETG